MQLFILILSVHAPHIKESIPLICNNRILKQNKGSLTGLINIVKRYFGSPCMIMLTFHSSQNVWGLSFVGLCHKQLKLIFECQNTLQLNVQKECRSHPHMQLFILILSVHAPHIKESIPLICNNRILKQNKGSLTGLINIVKRYFGSPCMIMLTFHSSQNVWGLSFVGLCHKQLKLIFECQNTLQLNVHIGLGRYCNQFDLVVRNIKMSLQ